jgi:ribosomal protein L31
MYRDIIIKMNEDFITNVKNTAKSTSTQNLQLILIDMENNPHEFYCNDIEIVFKLFNEEYNLRLKKITNEIWS